MTILRSDPAKVKLIKKVLNFTFWVLLGINISSSAWALKTNAAFSPTGGLFSIKIPFLPLDWLFALLISTGCTTITFSIVALFFTNPLGIPLFIEETIKNAKGSKKWLYTVVTILLFIVLIYTAFRMYVYDINTTAVGMGLPMIGKGLLSHPLNIPVFLVVAGPELISVLLHAHGKMESLEGASKTQTVRSSTQPSLE